MNLINIVNIKFPRLSRLSSHQQRPRLHHNWPGFLILYRAFFPLQFILLFSVVSILRALGKVNYGAEIRSM